MPRRRGVIALIIIAGMLLTALQAVLSRPLKLHRQHTRSNDTARLQGLAARLLAEEPDWETQGLKLTQTVVKWREDSGLSLCADEVDVLPPGSTPAPSIPKTMHATTKVGAVVTLTCSILGWPWEYRYPQVKGLVPPGPLLLPRKTHLCQDAVLKAQAFQLC